jgi:hypothetical protein
VSARIELIYGPDCPHLGLARDRLMKALRSAGLEDEWREWDQADEKSPDYTRDYASPTILIDGEDVSADGVEIDAQSCRLYRAEDGRLTGAPPELVIASALQRVR